MTRSRRRLIFIACGVAAFAASAILVWKGIELTLTLERQASLVFEDSAAREARARLPELEKALRSAVGAALENLLALPPDPPGEAIGRAMAAHPVIDAPFLLAADGSLAYPPPPGPPLAALAGDDPPPEEHLRALRLSLEPSHAAEAEAAFAAIAASPEVARPWRLRARAALAALQDRGGRPAEAAATYGAIEADFPEELPDAARPSRSQIGLLRALALGKAGDREGGREVLLRVLRDLEASGPASLGGDDAAVLLANSSAFLDAPHGKAAKGAEGAATRPADAPAGAAESAVKGEAAREGADGEFATAIGRLKASHSAAARSIAFSRSVRDWIAPRLARGGVPEPFEEGSGAERSLVAWSPGRAESGVAAAGFRVRPEAAAGVLAGVLAASFPGGAPRDGDLPPRSPRPSRARRLGTVPDDDLPLIATADPAPAGFQELARLPEPFGALRVGLDGPSWSRLTGTARRPFRIALALVVALALFLAGSAALGIRGLRREMFLARMKTEFVANVSHELKTPLALIRLFGETLLLGRVRDEWKAKEYFAIIARESERLTHLVNNILDFAGIEAGRKSIDLRPADLGRVIEETVEAYRFHLEERGFRLDLQVDPGLPSVLADPEAVAQALINLLNNAVKYSPQHKEVAVRAVRAAGSIRVSIADRGIGIAPSERSRVFEDFYRSPAARRLGTRGSGLGLTLVRRIVEAHGGSVELSSVLGEGSTFTMAFPVRETDGREGPPAGAGEEVAR